MESIQKVVNDKVLLMTEDGTIQKKIEESIEGAITSAINSQFQSYGHITKQIEKAIEEGLSISLKDLPFETYNEQMLVMVKQKVGELFKGAASDRFMKEMDRILDPAPKEMHINEFVERIVEFWKTDDPYENDDFDDYATVELELKYGNTSYSLEMWKQKESSSSYPTRSNSADLQLYIIDGAIRISHRQSYNPTCFSEEEAFIFKLYAARTILTDIDKFDPGDCDLTLKEEY